METRPRHKKQDISTSEPGAGASSLPVAWGAGRAMLVLLYQEGRLVRDTLGGLLTAGVSIIGVTVQQPPSDAPTNAYDVAIAAVVVGGAVAALSLYFSQDDESAPGDPPLNEPSE